MTDFLFNPGLIFLFGAAAVALLPFSLRRWLALIIPIISIFYIIGLETGDTQTANYLGYKLVFLRVDKLSLLWGYIFCIAFGLGVIFAFHQNTRFQDISAIIYAGSALGAVFAGDLLTLFIFWEFAAISSVFLIWAGGSSRSYGAGMRYLIIQISSGLLLFAGMLIRINSQGIIEFNAIGLETLAGKLVFVAFGIKCAFPFLHNWLQDSYPESTVSGTVFLSAFTTKLAVYALARGYAGTELLIYIGAVMTAFPIFFAIIENNLRKVLAYSLNSQLGFMVVGIGIGTQLSLNGTACHAFVSVLYTALLFMSMGAVLYRTGTVNASELGGIYKSMPYTTVFCVVGGMSISAVPLFSGFVAKSMILSAAAGEGYSITWLVLLMGSIGAMLHSGIKIPYFAFFSRDSGKRPQEAPVNMIVAMGITAALCLLIGLFPSTLYSALPYPVYYSPYSLSHVITQLQLLMFSILAFILLIKLGLYQREVSSVNLDFDILYRRYIPKVIVYIIKQGMRVSTKIEKLVVKVFFSSSLWIRKHHGLDGILAKTHPAGVMVSWVIGLLLIYLVLYFIG